MARHMRRFIVMAVDDSIVSPALLYIDMLAVVGTIAVFLLSINTLLFVNLLRVDQSSRQSCERSNADQPKASHQGM